jgi:hypothetical protein
MDSSIAWDDRIKTDRHAKWQRNDQADDGVGNQDDQSARSAEPAGDRQ